MNNCSSGGLLVIFTARVYNMLLQSCYDDEQKSVSGAHKTFDPQVARTARVDHLGVSGDTRTSKDMELHEYQRRPERRFRV